MGGTTLGHEYQLVKTSVGKGGGGWGGRGYLGGWLLKLLLSLCSEDFHISESSL